MKRIAIFITTIFLGTAVTAQEKKESKDSFYLLSPVEVRAIRAADQAPFTKTNISKKEIVKNNLGQDIPFLLNQTPSVVINSDAGNGVGYTGIRIRGTDATRINVTLNGIPYNDAESQGTFFVNLPDFSSSVNSIQVQRGAGTSSNGAGAFGASINMSTNEVNKAPYAEINNTYGSFNTWKNTIKAGSGLLQDHFTVDARLSSITSDGYMERASTNLKSAYISAAYLGERNSLRLNVFTGKEKTYLAWDGTPEAMLKINRRYNSNGTEKPGEPYKNETDNYVQTHYQLFFTQQLNKDLSFNTALFLTRGKGYYEQYKAGREYAEFGLPDPVYNGAPVTESDFVRQLWLDNYFYGNTFSLQYKKKATQLVLGGAFTRYDGEHYGKLIWALHGGLPEPSYKWVENDAHKTDFNIYGKWLQKLGVKWNLFTDLQYRRVGYSINGFRDRPTVVINTSYNFFNPKAGISYNHNNWNAYFSYGIAAKEPNRDDFETGATQLPKPERLHDFELGIEKRTAGYNWGATLYYMLYRNQLVVTGQINDVGAYTRTNIPNSYRMGIELQAGAKISRWMNVAGNLALSRNKVSDFREYLDDYDNGGQKINTYSTTDIALSPAVVGAASLNFIPAAGMEFSLLGKYVSKQYLDNTQNDKRVLGDYYVQDARLSYTWKRKRSPEITLIGQVNNLFNRKYEPNGYTYSWFEGGETLTSNLYLPMAGTNFMIGINVRL